MHNMLATAKGSTVTHEHVRHSSSRLMNRTQFGINILQRLTVQSDIHLTRSHLVLKVATLWSRPNGMVATKGPVQATSPSRVTLDSAGALPQARVNQEPVTTQEHTGACV